MKEVKEIIRNNKIKELTYSIVNKNAIFKNLCISKHSYLIFAIESNCSIEMIKLLLPYFSNLNYEYNKKVPLFIAIENHKFDIADLLLQMGARINSCNNNKEYILFYLYNRKKLDKLNLKYILSKNININKKYNNLHFIEYLIKNNNSTNNSTNNNSNNRGNNNNNSNNNNNNNNNNNSNSNNNSIFITGNIINGNSINNNKKIYELIKTIFESLTFNNEFIINLLYLYKHKALKMSYIKEKMETENKKIIITKSMYDFAIISDNIKVIELLLKYENKDKIFKKKGGYELLLTACKLNRSFIIEWLIKNGIDINEKDTKGRNALMIASQSGNLDIIEILIENNISINERDYDNKNALIYATEKGNLKVVQYLIKKKININVSSLSNGWNALFYAICKNYNDIALYLIDNDIDMYGNNLKNCFSRNILSYAYEKKKILVFFPI